jgi:hypothetical protein
MGSVSMLLLQLSAMTQVPSKARGMMRPCQMGFVEAERTLASFRVSMQEGSGLRWGNLLVFCYCHGVLSSECWKLHRLPLILGRTLQWIYIGENENSTEGKSHAAKTLIGQFQSNIRLLSCRHFIADPDL